MNEEKSKPQPGNMKIKNYEIEQEEIENYKKQSKNSKKKRKNNSKQRKAN